MARVSSLRLSLVVHFSSVCYAAVIANLFEWTYPSVGAECTNFLGKAGYKYVLVSPASEHVTGGQWWTSYQRVSSKIQSKHGSREDFRNMVNACKGAGVQVLVDVIWNHMAGSDDGWGVAGTRAYAIILREGRSR